MRDQQQDREPFDAATIAAMVAVALRLADRPDAPVHRMGGPGR
jgi:hypothetical protein